MDAMGRPRRPLFIRRRAQNRDGVANGAVAYGSAAARTTMAGIRLAICAAGLLTSAATQADDGPPLTYGDSGTSEVSLQLGFSSDGFAAGGGFRHFVVRGLAPGIEGIYYQHDGRGQGQVFGTLRLAPLRVASFVPVITGRAGRVFISDHASGWAVGADVGVLLFASPNIAFEVGYGFLRLLPESFCADLSACTLYQPVFGLRVSF
jgi:hypothetical protein